MKKNMHQETAAFVVEGVNLSCSILYSRRRTASISVHPDLSVIIRAPIRSDRTELDRWISSKLPWILKHLENFQKGSEYAKVYRFENGENQLYLGTERSLQIRTANKESVLISERQILVKARTEEPAHIKKLIYRELEKKAASLFSERLKICHQKTEKHFLPYPPLRVRWMKSRWGSCSYLKGVTLNLHLIRMPVDMIDYVILHELCHLRVPNHGPDFYRIMEDLVPDWKEKNLVLRKFGMTVLPNA